MQTGFFALINQGAVTFFEDIAVGFHKFQARWSGLAFKILLVVFKTELAVDLRKVFQADGAAGIVEFINLLVISFVDMLVDVVNFGFGLLIFVVSLGPGRITSANIVGTS